ncbi:hypothetical protein [Larsenimonas rhizosphaerae]|uniref:Uncharacterized protein n=1 Tax=Larsenimonas rhizosphaerae TaxID=2944682 RepID=A0AA41ZH77_9GAMM|nr:hypothetical protein [Larsenimonas rhizosphaerae]MCX2524069.1 hypothetical protein [Larsenimonas rhizosphaerae]
MPIGTGWLCHWTPLKLPRTGAVSDRRAEGGAWVYRLVFDEAGRFNSIYGIKLIKGWVLFKENHESRFNSLFDWVKSISIIMLVAVFCYKVYDTPLNFEVDFSAFLSLVLAISSVFLSALFYFKATETSNRFYDNNYKFTKDISDLLVKIESGFGERLKNLDEGYSAMRSQLHNDKGYESNKEFKGKIKSEEKEIEKVIKERNDILEKFIEKAQLEKSEKDKLISSLKEKEDELIKSQRDLNKMKSKFLVRRINRMSSNSGLQSALENYTYNKVVSKIDFSKVIFLDDSKFKSEVDEILSMCSLQYISDLEGRGYFDNGLTDKGINFMRQVAIKFEKE